MQKQYWTIWEHFEPLGRSQLKLSKSETKFVQNFQIIGEFCNVDEFNQVLEVIPHKKLQNIFYNGDSQKIQLFEIQDQLQRITTISIFRRDIIPQWEDEMNRNGCSFQLNFFGLSQMDILEKIWHQLVQDFIDGKLKDLQNITGINIVDRSDDSGLYSRIEIWLSNRETHIVKKYIQDDIQKDLFNANIKSQLKLVYHRV